MEENKMTINESSRTITLSKKEMTAASRVGSSEYKKLQTARRDYPDFRVTTVTRKVKTQREAYKGLTYAYMEKYIAAHDDEKKSIMAEYNKYRGIAEDSAVLLPAPYTYSEMKEWFLGKFKDIAKFYESRK